MSASVQTWKLAICLFNDVGALDYQGPLELFGLLAPHSVLRPVGDPLRIDSKIAIEVTYLAPTTEPVKPFSGPLILPTKTYDDVGPNEQFDIFLVPGGDGAVPDAVPQSLLSFIKRQTPGAKYVLSACTGSWILAQAGILTGKRATTNKFLYNVIKDATKDLGIEWVPKARWVVDGNVWTSSGVTAGIDMAHAFLVHLIGEESTRTIRGRTEVSIREEGDDEFAAFHGLV